MNKAVIGAVIGAAGVILAAMIGAYATMSSQRNTPATHSAVVKSGSNNSATDQSGNQGIITGPHNQGTQIQNSRDFVINQAHVSTHPVTSDMNLKWNMDDFAETVRNGNLPAIKEYLNPKDGFSPNALWNGDVFVLQLPLSQSTSNFASILQVFSETGKLDWNAVNERVVFYGHIITQEWALLNDAACGNHPENLKALINAGADPKTLIRDKVREFNTPEQEAGLWRGVLTGRSRDSQGATAEQELAMFKQIDYPLPGIQQAISKASVTGKPCVQDVKSHHTFQEAMALANKPPQQASDQNLDWQSFEVAVAHLRKHLSYGPPTVRTYQEEYEMAIWEACSPNGLL